MADVASQSPENKLPHRLWLVPTLIAVVVYCCVFLWLPLREGVVGSEGEAISRARYVFTSLFYPEMRLATWVDGGRLPVGFSDRIPIFLVTCVWLGLSALIGLPLIKPVRRSVATWSSRVEQVAFAMLVGLALLSSLVLVLGLIGGLKSGVFLSAAILVLLCAVYGVSRLSSIAAKPSEILEASRASTIVLRRSTMESVFFVLVIGLTCIASTIVMLGAWLPPSEFDVLEYHLQAPKEFFQMGFIRFVPHNIYANMPLGTEMHSLAMMTLIREPDAWLGGVIGKSITASISLVGAALLGAFVAQKLGGLFGWTAAGLWLTSPGIAQVAMFGLIDGALAAYVLASGVATYYAIDAMGDSMVSGDPDSVHSKAARHRIVTYWRLAGITSGAAAATKYPGLILAVVPVCVFFIWSVWRYRSVFQKREAILTACLLVTELTATCGFWYAKNWVFTGNPVYPLVADVFGGKTLTPEKIAQWKRAHVSPDSATTNKESPKSEKASYFRSVSIAAFDVARLTLTSSYVQPAMLLGLFACLFGIRKIRCDGELRLIVMWGAWSLWIVAVWWFATHRIDRFWLPLTGLWAGLGAIGFWLLYRNVSPNLTYTIVLLGLGYGCVINSSPATADNRFFVSLNALRQDVGDENQVPRLFPTTAWINWNLTDTKTRILLVGEARAFEFLPAIEYSTCFDLNPGEIYLRGKARDEQIAVLRERGITHLLVQWTEINRYRKPTNYGFSDWPQEADVQKLVDDGVVSRIDWGFPQKYAELLEVK
jgi:hypothetical protein